MVDTESVKLTRAKDYTITYFNNTKVGISTVKIMCKGSYKGSTI